MRRALVCVAAAGLAGAAVLAAPAPVDRGDPDLKVLVPSSRTGNSELFLANLEWADARNLTRHKGDDTFPCWSADGKKVTFISDRDGRPNVYVMDADGKGVKRLTTEAGENDWCSCPCWSADGKKIAYGRFKADKGSAVLVMDADGSNQKSVKDGGWDPAWSPDGKKIAFTMWTEKGFKVCVMDPDGENVKVFETNDNTLGNVYPAWSPDGKKIAYTDLVEGGGLEIHVCDADGTNIKKLTAAGGYNMAAAWSADGKAVAFQHGDGTGPTSLYLVDADGSNARELPAFREPTPPVRGVRPAWRPK